MPLPHIPKNTEYIPAGPVTFGVEYRVLNSNKKPAQSLADVADGGVSIHVFSNHGTELTEYLRFDCFEKDHHYHYIFPQPLGLGLRCQLDPIAEGDLIEWSVERLSSRLAPMLARAGAKELAQQIDWEAVQAALPAVRAAIERARCKVYP